MSLVIIYRLFRKVAENKRIRWFSKLILIGAGARGHKLATVMSRTTVSTPVSQLCLNFVGGLCSGRTGLVLTKKSTIIGRGDECDIVLQGETVSRRHCSITQWGSVYVLQDTSRNGTLLNDERVVEAQLRDQDRVRVGQNLLLVSITPRTGTRELKRQETTPVETAWVIEMRPHIVVNGLAAGVTHPFGEDRITIGRRAGNHLVLDADNISREHVAFERRNDQYYIVDLGSANGTYLNDERVVSASPLSQGDRVRIGNYELQVTLREQDCILNFVSKSSKPIGE